MKLIIYKNIVLKTINLISIMGVYTLGQIIRFYKIFISPLVPSTCKYYPSCSSYAIKSIKRHGLLKGVYFSIIRILKCNPFSSGGIDLVKG